MDDEGHHGPRVDPEEIQMRRALAATALAVVATCGPLGVHAASAAPVAAPATSVVAVDDEPLSNDGSDDTGKYGLIGLSGLLGLFGYKKYTEHRARRTGTPVGGIDEDGTGSRRV